MTDPIKWFISILSGCAQSRKGKSGRKKSRKRRGKKYEGKDVEEEGDVRVEEGKRREEGRSKIKRVVLVGSSYGGLQELREQLLRVWAEESTRV